MRRIDSYGRKTCWIDVFEQSFLGGTMRRVFGPRQLKNLVAGSLIVGPAAHVSVTCQPRGKQRSGKSVTVTLKSNRVIADLAKLTRGAVICEAQIHCSSAK